MTKLWFHLSTNLVIMKCVLRRNNEYYSKANKSFCPFIIKCIGTIPTLLTNLPLKIRIFEIAWLTLIELKQINNQNMKFREDWLKRIWSKIGGAEWLNH